jgi:hypothetical protein
VQPALVAAVAEFAELTHGEMPSNPIAAMAEPMLVLSERDPEQGLAIFDRYLVSADPWVRAAAPMMRCLFARMLGRIDRAESDYRDSLAAFRVLGDAWGASSVLIQLAEIVKLRATTRPRSRPCRTPRHLASSCPPGVTLPTSTACSPRSGSARAT